MSYGLQISASGVAAALYRQDVYANNLANMDTPGFKPDVPITRPRQDVRHEDGVMNLPSNRLLERLGAGVLMSPNRTSFSQGSLKDTGNPLDVGIVGDGFLIVEDQTHEQSGRVKLTRDGRMARDAQGRLVLASSGRPVLSTNQRPIILAPQGEVRIDGDGTVRQRGVEVGRLALVKVADPGALTKEGQSLYAASSDVLGSMGPATGTLRPGAYEESAADEIATIMQVTGASRDVDANVALIQQHDRLMDRAINVLGRVN
jgi:flagellar basal-body rod protein FlgF